MAVNLSGDGIFRVAMRQFRIPLELPSRYLPSDPTFCKHRMVIVKRWTEDGIFNAILKCRRYACDTWTRKSIALKQDSQASLKIISQKYEESGPNGTKD